MDATLDKGAAYFRGRRLSHLTLKRYSELADEDLAALIEGGDAEALAVLYERHARAVHALAYRIAGRQLDTEDLVQDAFLKVARSAQTYNKARGSVRSWILTIAHNLTVDRLRSAASRRKAQKRLEGSARQVNDAFDEVWSNARAEQVHEALETLPPEQFRVIQMSYFLGYTHMEIARALDLSPGTVKSRLRLGTKKIRHHLLRYHGPSVLRAS